MLLSAQVLRLGSTTGFIKYTKLIQIAKMKNIHKEKMDTFFNNVS